MEKIQERALRFLYCNIQSSYKELRGKAGVSTLYVGRLRTVMCEVYKVVNHMGLFNSRRNILQYRIAFMKLARLCRLCYLNLGR